MLKKALILAAVFAVSGLCAFLFFGLTEKDIVAVNKFSYPTGAEPLTAGDIVVISNSGPPSKLCDTFIDAGGFDDVEAQDVYVNRAKLFMGWFTQVGSKVGIIPDDLTKLSADVGGLAFFGSRSALSLEKAGLEVSQRCKCDMARSFSKGELVCTVNASLIETGEVMTYSDGTATLRPVQRNLGVSLRRHPIFLPEAVFESCGIPYSSEAKIAQQRLCNENGLPTDVRVRDYFNLIDRRPFTEKIELVWEDG
ncbi:hypothetical protein [Poseidonocella sedimentorum]|uniref:Uncharacterized protein n=1 Tax=Poseidonocella sedimentorum TaxID=871652 RepID=A0A1I6CPU8_9RHOB|nr:hypothetical protein [Poseidonocella sedimentorum]SFQ95178.1 hypothetical protein SAMN04515673_101166 [Poseidonocella sedimentorum]